MAAYSFQAGDTIDGYLVLPGVCVLAMRHATVTMTSNALEQTTVFDSGFSNYTPYSQTVTLEATSYGYHADDLLERFLRVYESNRGDDFTEKLVLSVVEALERKD